MSDGWAVWLTKYGRSHVGIDLGEPPGRQADGSSDRRWIILAEDGRSSIIGRARDPSEADIDAAEASLARNGTGGWLAVMSGSQYSRELPTLLEVRPLNNPAVPFARAAAKMTAAMVIERRQSGIG